MCFSSGASFIASGVLGAVGLITVNKAKERSQKLFAALPLVFSIQQLVEGFVWVSIKNNYEIFENVSAHFFIIIAQVFWPFLVP